MSIKRAMVAAIVITLLVLNIIEWHGKGMKAYCKAFLSCVPVNLLFVVTCILYFPSSIVITNKDEFNIGFGTILPIVIIASILVFLVLGLAGNAVYNCTIVYRLYVGFLWGVGVCFYIQGNFLNKNLPQLDGQIIDWSVYSSHAIFEIIVWAIAIVGAVILSIKKNDIAKKLFTRISLAFVAMQMVSLVVLVVNSGDTVHNNVALSKEDEFTLGSDGNIVVFVLDSLSPGEFSEALEIEDDLLWAGEDFTLYDNAVSGGAYTLIGMPTLLTGMEYDPTYIAHSAWLGEAWNDTTIYDDLNYSGYDVRIYTDGRYLTNVSGDDICNVVEINGKGYHIVEIEGFIQKLYQLSGYYSLPTIVKQYMRFYTDEITGLIESDLSGTHIEDLTAEEVEEDVYILNDDVFHKELDNNGLVIKYDKAYRLYHLMGPHAPYTLSLEGYTSDNGETDEITQTIGSLRIVEQYIQKMKELGVYENSTIIITADHGRASEGYQQNHCVAIKEAGQSHIYAVDSRPIHVKNVISYIMHVASDNGDLYGPSIEDIYESGDIKRLHTSVVIENGQEKGIDRFVIPEDASDSDRIEPLNSNEINKFDCKLGEEIELVQDNQDNKVICNNIYYDVVDDAAYLSGEVFLNPTITDYNSDSVTLNISISDILNDVQNFKIYASGYRIANISLGSGDVGKALSIEIPEKCIEKGDVHLRLVFKNAVTPRQIGILDDDRIMSIAINRMWFE